MRKCINPASHLYCCAMDQLVHRAALTIILPKTRWPGAWASEATIQSPNGSSSEARRPGPHTRPMMRSAVVQDAAIAASWRAAELSRRQASTKDATEPISTPAISQAVTNAIMLILSLRCGRPAPQATTSI